MDDLGLDPELAALLDNTPVKKMSPVLSKAALFSSSSEASGGIVKGPGDVDLLVKEFTKITKILDDRPSPVYNDPSYYKKVLGNENETAQRIHTLLSKYLTCQDPKDRGVYRQQIVTAYWDFVSNLALRAGSGNIDLPKKYALRYGLLLPTLLTVEQKDLFSRVIEHNIYGEPIYYLDEWLFAIGAGKINPSSTDEAKTSRSDDSERFQQLLGKAQGKLQSAENLLRAKSDERLRAEESLKSRVALICEHEALAGFSGVKAGYNDSQKRTISEVAELLRGLVDLDKELAGFISDYQDAEADVRGLQQKVDATGGGKTNASGVTSEFETIRQMAKMTCGRQGNHFPILTREFFHSSSREVGIRENVIETLRWIESIDPQAYCR